MILSIDPIRWVLDPTTISWGPFAEAMIQVIQQWLLQFPTGSQLGVAAEVTAQGATIFLTQAQPPGQSPILQADSRGIIQLDVQPSILTADQQTSLTATLADKVPGLLKDTIQQAMQNGLLKAVPDV